MNKGMCIHNMLFVAINYLLYTDTVKSVRELCVVSYCVYLKITYAWISHERGASVDVGHYCVKSVQSKAGPDLWISGQKATLAFWTSEANLAEEE
jgi:hypothetical protein